MEKKLKVCIVVNNLGIGGAERVVVEEVNEMKRQGLEVSLITIKKQPQKNFLSNLKIGRDQLVEIDFKHLIDLKSLWQLIKVFKTIAPDLVITHLWFANTLGRVAGIISGVSRIITFEQNVYDSLKTKKMFFVDRILQVCSYKIIAVSKAVKSSLIRHGINKNKIDVIYNSVDSSPFKNEYSKQEFYKKFSIPEDAFTFVFVGRLIHQKAVDVLIKSFSEISGGPFLLIAGQGDQLEDLKKIVQERGIKDRVLFLGVVENIPELLYCSDCFILPSRYEGLPLVLMEALCSGKAIIVSDFEAAKEVINDGVNGLIVPREREKELSEAMNRIMADPDLRTRLSKEAKISSEHFSIQNHVHAILRYVK